jgi:hypothetical protein
LETLDGFYTPYLQQGSPEIPNWKSRNPNGWHRPAPAAPIQQVHSPEAHKAAAQGDIDRLHKVAKSNKKALHHKDGNGWQPIHEAARGGHTEVVKLLLQHGVDKNARTGPTGKGSSPLNLAKEYHDDNHELVNYLMGIGALDLGYEEL